MSRLKNILKQLTKKGIKPFIDGVSNFYNPIEEIEELAEERVQTCIGCEHYQDEPIEWMKVKDERIPEASGKYCPACECILSYKLRNIKDVCEKWQEKK